MSDEWYEFTGTVTSIDFSKEINDRINEMVESGKARARAGAMRIRVTYDDDTVDEIVPE